MKVTNLNYFSLKNQLKYMGASQYKSFVSCEARAMAEIRGEYQQDKTTSLLVGSYVDAHYNNALDQFKEQNPEIFTKQGSLKSEYRQADYIIDRIESDSLFQKYMSGKKQVIKTGKINGVDFKIKMDSYHKGKAIVDLKVVKDFAPIYKPGQGKVNFIEAWGYDIQGAIYQTIEGNKLPFFIAGVTKEREPDIAIIKVPQQRLDDCLAQVKHNISRFEAVKKGLSESIRCEKCDYCKRTKTLTRVMNMEDFDNVQ